MGMKQRIKFIQQEKENILHSLSKKEIGPEHAQNLLNQCDIKLRKEIIRHNEAVERFRDSNRYWRKSKKEKNV